jgi:hypothetical protein
MNPNSQNNQQQAPQPTPAVPQQAPRPTQQAGEYGSYGPQPAVAGTGGYVQPQPQAQQQAPVQKSNPNSTQNTLQIAEIRDGVVIMNDGSFRSVVMLKSINFDLMSPQEREGVEFAYQGFLNSLYFDIQIFIRSQKVDMRPYIQKLDKIRTEHDNMLLALLMDDYLGFIEDLVMQTNIMDKKFYIVIPYYPKIDLKNAVSSSKGFFEGIKNSIAGEKDHHVTINESDLNAAKDELRNRVQAVLAGLQGCGVPGLPLDTQELIELYYDTYNPDTATRQQLKNFDTLSAPVVTKGQGHAENPNLNKDLPQ